MSAQSPEPKVWNFSRHPTSGDFVFCRDTGEYGRFQYRDRKYCLEYIREERLPASAPWSPGFEDRLHDGKIKVVEFGGEFYRFMGKKPGYEVNGSEGRESSKVPDKVRNILEAA